MIWIFVAIALFAALGMTVANIGRTGPQGRMKELGKMQATDIMQYASAVQRAIRTMRIDGVEETNICFDASQWGHADYQFNPPCTDDANARC